jgi:hypothetical protein
MTAITGHTIRLRHNTFWSIIIANCHPEKKELQPLNLERN